MLIRIHVANLFFGYQNISIVRWPIQGYDPKGIRKRCTYKKAINNP